MHVEECSQASLELARTAASSEEGVKNQDLLISERLSMMPATDAAADLDAYAHSQCHEESCFKTRLFH